MAHRDLKPENILLDRNYELKIADFGLSCSLYGVDNSGLSKSFVGTLSYMAPEIIKQEPYRGDKADLFASAVILFIMFTGAMPFVMASSNDVDYKNLIENRHD